MDPPLCLPRGRCRTGLGTVWRGFRALPVAPARSLARRRDGAPGPLVRSRKGGLR